MSFENILFQRSNSLGLITINRPKKHNAISLATLEDLEAAVDMCSKDVGKHTNV